MRSIKEIQRKIKRHYAIFKSNIKCYYLNSITASPFWSSRMRQMLLCVYGHKVGNMKSKCFIGEGPGHIIMGKNSFCNVRCLFDCANDIIIGDNCSIAYGVTFVNSTHDVGTSEKRAGGAKMLPLWLRMVFG